ncbi:MAG: hypothetical protein V4726_15100 [Verrucomicrobiota bacterium]
MGRVNFTPGRTDSTVGRINSTTGSADSTAGRIDSTTGWADSTAGRIDCATGWADCTTGCAGSTPGRTGSTVVCVDSATGCLHSVSGRADLRSGEPLQLKVAGKVILTGNTLSLSGAYTPAGADSFKIIDNDGTADAVTGTFNTKVLRISYIGGDGNDVVLTRVNTEPTLSDVADVTINEDGVLEYTDNPQPAPPRRFYRTIANPSAGAGEGQ